MKSPILAVLTTLSVFIILCFVFNLPNAWEILYIGIIYGIMCICLNLMISPDKPLLIEEKEYDIVDEDFEKLVEETVRRREIEKLRKKIKNMSKKSFNNKDKD